MPDRLGVDLDGDGMIDYAGSAGEFEDAEGGFAVDLEVRADLCRKDLTYVWRSAAGERVEQGRRGCRVRQTFASEGTFPITLEVRDADGTVELYSREIVVQDWLIVSIGDSVASGEGNPEVGARFRGEEWQSERCHRSSVASPAQAALALEGADPHTSTTFVHLACSGAKLGIGLLRPYAGIEKPRDATRLPPQVNELERIDEVRDVDAVLVSIGANDVYFGPMVRFCIIKRNCTEKRFDPEDPERPIAGQPPPLPEVVDAALGRLEAGYAELANRLAGVVEPERTLIVDYFDPTHDKDGEFCKRIGFLDPVFKTFQIDQGEAKWASDHVLAPLNREIASAADAADWTEVTGVAEAFGTRGYCADGSWIRRLVRSLLRQRDLLGALHPNEDGHRATALLLGGTLRRVLAQGQKSLADEVASLVEDENDLGNDQVVVRLEQEPAQSEGEGDAEHTAVIALPIAAVLAVLVVALLGWVLGRRFAAPAGAVLYGEPTEGTPPTEWPPPESVEAFGAMLEASADEGGSHWVHRRVESIEILDERMVRRRVSVDFTPEAAQGAPTYAPIALLAKGTLTRFDLRDEAEASVPLLTREQNSAFSTAHMLKIAEEAAGGQPLPARLVSLCWTIASGDPYEADEAIFEVATQLEPESLRQALRDSDRFRSVTDTFAYSFPVMVAMDDPSRRRVIKLAYNDVVSGALPGFQRLGIDPVLLPIDLPELGDANSRHIEFLVADGLDAFDAQLLGEAPDGTLIASEGDEEGAEPHLVVANAPRGSQGSAGVWLRASRTGVLVGGPLLAMLSAAALTAAWFALPQLAGETAGGAASILLAVPAALAAYLSARQLHPLEAALLGGPRALVFCSGILAFVGAGALALDSSVDSLRILLGIVALLSWLPVAGLALTYFLPRGPPSG
ncbi:MAG: SGNH/GDSL hydrolase family protein [Solirubrobacterales bacterium]